MFTNENTCAIFCFDNEINKKMIDFDWIFCLKIQKKKKDRTTCFVLPDINTQHTMARSWPCKWLLFICNAARVLLLLFGLYWAPSCFFFTVFLSFYPTFAFFPSFSFFFIWLAHIFLISQTFVVAFFSYLKSMEHIFNSWIYRRCV